MRLSRCLPALCDAAVLLLLCASPARAQRPTVTIASGVVVGTTTRLPGATAPVNKFIGVPYAQSPPERFSPPNDAPSWTHPLDAVETKPSCMQQFNYKGGADTGRKRTMQVFYYPGGPPPNEGEDCMYLNIYTPEGTTPSSNKTVMFYVFGGNQQFGGGGWHWWDGTSFAYHQDVIMVTVSRRTNVFGFPSSKEIPEDQRNLGFLDLRFALSWVQDNIAHFGGDPGKVTIFGESSGATDVKMLMALPQNPVPFRAVIMESEASSNVGHGINDWPKLLKIMKCDKAKSGLACMRTKSATAIQSAIEHNQLLFPPVIDNKTYVLDTRPFVSAGTAAKVPFMTGTNKDEGRPFVFDDGLDNSTALVVNFLAPFFLGEKPLLTTLAAVLFPFGQISYLAASKVITDLLFVCRSAALTQYYQSHGYAVHRYVYNSSFPNLKTFPDPGVYHSSEIPIIWGTYHNNNATNAQRKFSKFMQKTWASFAKDPQKGPGFPALGSGAGKIGVLQTSGLQVVSAQSIDTASQCEIYQPIIEPRGF